MPGHAASGAAMFTGFSSDTLQTILWVLSGVSVLFTLRVILFPKRG